MFELKRVKRSRESEEEEEAEGREELFNSNGIFIAPKHQHDSLNLSLLPKLTQSKPKFKSAQTSFLWLTYLALAVLISCNLHHHQQQHHHRQVALVGVSGQQVASNLPTVLVRGFLVSYV